MLKKFLLTMTGYAAVALLTACTLGSNPIKEAETFEQKAYALYGSYVIFQGKAADLKLSAAVPESVKQALSDVDRVTYPVADNLVGAALTVTEIRDLLVICKNDPAPEEIKACEQTSEETLAAAVTNLSKIYFIAQPQILKMISTVKEVK